MENTTYSFTEAYAQLNSAQKKAVDTIEGPVLVVAGPGTGKTQILAARIGNILHLGATHAENILCLTYTEAGVTAMRKRLIKFIGAEAYKVNIHTFHSFCNKVIQDNPNSFGFGEMEPISDLESIELLEKMIDTFADNHPLKRWRGKIYYETTRLKNLFSLMKRENFTANDIEKAVGKYLEELPSKEGFYYKNKYKEFKAGDPKTHLISKEKEKFDATIAAAKEFDNYQNLKKDSGRYDYDDMIADVMKTFQNNEWLLSRYQEQFQYFLVDEYQDTNGSQNEILRLLISYWEKPNVFVVGDDDQSIYRFQGANLENIVQFYKENLAKLTVEEQEKRVVVLKNNYRSTQQILDIAKQSIANNKERLIHQIKDIALDKNLQASGTVAENITVKPTIVSYPNVSHEIADICNQIESLRQNGVKLNEIGVLYRQHDQSIDIQSCLNQKNIAVNTVKKLNILHQPLTNMMLSILTYISEENRIPHSREDLLFDILHYPFFGIKPIQVARLSFELRESRYSKPKTTWREALQNLDKLFDEESVKKINYVAKLCDKWQQDLQEKPLQLLFQTILDDVKCIEYIKQHDEKVWLLQELKTLFDFVKQENTKNPTLSVSQFLSIIAQLHEYGISVPFIKSTYAETAVQLTSIHGAKGLEFKYVFVIGCVSKLWEDKRGRNSTYKLPEGLVDTVEKESKIEDLRRLFFVALTRAELYLQISYYNQDSNGKDLTPSLFITEIEKNEQLEIKERALSDEAIFEYNTFQLLIDKIQPELLEANMLKSRLENYKMSVTHLNNYLKCPIKFYYYNFIQIPQAKNSIMAFGSAVHDAIENLFKEMLANDKVFPSEAKFVELAKKSMYKQQDSFTKKEYEQKVSYLEKFLPEYYNNYINEWLTNVNLEKKLTAVYKGINLTGKLDKIEFNSNNNINIIDYKTGQFSNKKKALFSPPKQPKDENKITHEEAHGGDYWRQAVFYKILLDNSTDIHQKLWNLEKTEFDFVEPDASDGKFYRQQVVVSPTDVELVNQQIIDTYENIKALNFTGCGKEDCEWCASESAKERNDF